MKKILLFVILVVSGLSLKAQWPTNGTAIYYLNGNVGIGTNSPSEKLEINGKIKIGSRLAMTPSTFGYSSSWKALILGSTGSNYQTDAVTVSFGYDPSGNTSGAYTGNGGEILFRNKMTFIQPTSANNGYLNTLTLDNGNVGIGTENPTSWFGGKILEIKDSRPVLKLNSSSLSTITFTNQTLNESNHSGEFHINYRFNSSQQEKSLLTFDSYPTQNILNIQSNGNVGIGTTNPQSLLAVKGKITAQEVEVSLTGWSDFVFDKNYNLISLEDLEKYIKENNHLPDVPSEKEVLENGLNLGQSDARLLQKIEELTLYLIEQNKTQKELLKTVELQQQEIQQLKEEIKGLKK